MRNTTVMGIAMVIAVLSTLAISGCFEKSLTINDFEVENSELVGPIWEGYHYEIDSGEQIKLILTVRNKGEEIVSRYDYYVGIKIIPPDRGNKYWELPAEQLLGRDLSSNGEVTHTFTIKQKKEEPVSGEFEILAYIRSLESDEEVVQSYPVTIKVAAT